jgi:hypothetical protein
VTVGLGFIIYEIKIFYACGLLGTLEIATDTKHANDRDYAPFNCEHEGTMAHGHPVAVLVNH